MSLLGVVCACIGGCLKIFAEPAPEALLRELSDAWYLLTAIGAGAVSLRADDGTVA